MDDARTIKAVIFADEHTDMWIAQGLEFDICVQAKTLEDVHNAFEKAVAATALASIQEGKEPFAGIDSAPRIFWDMYEKAQKRPPLRKSTSVPVRGWHPLNLLERLAVA
jgi:hypothetical protein